MNQKDRAEVREMISSSMKDAMANFTPPAANAGNDGMQQSMDRLVELNEKAFGLLGSLGVFPTAASTQPPPAPQQTEQVINTLQGPPQPAPQPAPQVQPVQPQAPQPAPQQAAPTAQPQSELGQILAELRALRTGQAPQIAPAWAPPPQVAGQPAPHQNEELGRALQRVYQLSSKPDGSVDVDSIASHMSRGMGEEKFATMTRQLAARYLPSDSWDILGYTWDTNKFAWLCQVAGVGVVLLGAAEIVGMVTGWDQIRFLSKLAGWIQGQ